jgi:ATP-binding cassette subfamily B protein
MLLLMLRNTFYSLFIVIGGLYYLYVTLKIDISLMLLIALIIGIIAVGVAVVYIVVMPKFSAGQKFLDKINLVTRERLSGVLVIRANNNEPREEEKYEGVNRNITKVGLFIDRTIALLNPLMLLLLNILGIIIVYTVVDRNFLVDGSILPGTLLAFLQYAIQIIFAVMIVAGLFVFLPRAVVAMRRIAEILSEKPIVADPENPLDIDLDGVNLGDINSQGGYSEGDMNSEKQALDRLTDMNSQNGVNSEKQALDRLTDMNPQKGYSEEEKKRDLLVVMLSAAKNMRAKNTNSVESDKDGKNKFDIKFENVSFKYSGADAYALKDVSFEAKSGKTTAIVGVTGSGKTTLVNLILRFYDPTEGAIFVNGVDIRRVRQADLRKHIGFVSQQPTLFSGTVGENLSAGNENASAADMDHAIAVAKADDFVNGRDFKGAYSYDGGNEPDKYDAVISREGKNISGGQKQRLSIARAVVRKPRLYVLDDSFSALDYLTEANLRAELTREAKENNVGVIVISQRIASVLNADDIIALDGGRIIGRGTHSELMKTCPQYGALARSQLPEDEL